MDPANSAPPPVFLPPGSPPPPPPIPVLPINQDGIVTDDVPCRGCSYNVRGLHQAGKCPECGTPVGLSIRGNLLCYSDPAWVEKLALGIDLTLWGILVGFLAGLAGGVLAVTVNPALAPVIGFLGSLVGLAGAWLLTSPDPGTEEQSQVVSARRIVRFALIVAVAQHMTGFVRQAEIQPMLSSLLGVLFVLVAMVSVAGEIARLYYLKNLALRIPDPALVKRAHMLMWGYGISLGVVAILSAVMTLMMMTMKMSVRGFMPFFGCFAGLAGLAMLGFLIVYLIMLFAFRKALKMQAIIARQTWTAISAPATLAPPPPTTNLPQ